MEKKYLEGQLVYERIRPLQKLVIKRVALNLYYCQPEGDTKNRQLTYLERDLAAVDFVGKNFKTDNYAGRITQ